MTWNRKLAGLVVAAMCGVALSAQACLNDRHIVASENQFKSSYIEKKPTPEPGPLARVPVGGWIALGTGAALLGATVVAWRSPGRRR
jgi:hypothetical protein